jgi:hypothetical protein
VDVIDQSYEGWLPQSDGLIAGLYIPLIPSSDPFCGTINEHGSWSQQGPCEALTFDGEHERIGDRVTGVSFEYNARGLLCEDIGTLSGLWISGIICGLTMSSA